MLNNVKINSGEVFKSNDNDKAIFFEMINKTRGFFEINDKFIQLKIKCNVNNKLFIEYKNKKYFL